MSEVKSICARAPSPEKLQRQLDRLLQGYTPDDILGVAHTCATKSSMQSGGIWRGASHAHQLEYSAVVLVRSS
jgi:hypothetical protein